MGAGILIFLLVLLPENKCENETLENWNLQIFAHPARNFKNYKFGTLEFDDAKQKNLICL